MKKTYETPSIEVVKFQYRDQVVVASNGVTTNCSLKWYNYDTFGNTNCETKYEYTGNEGPSGAA